MSRTLRTKRVGKMDAPSLTDDTSGTLSVRA